MTYAHATDLHPDGGIAFEHAVALARDSGTPLVTLYANPADGETARSLPTAGELLQKWGQPADAVAHERTTHECCDEPVEGIVDALRTIEPELLIIGTHRPTGLKRLFKGSVATEVAENVRIPTLILPIGGRGFVDSSAGSIQLRRILVPIGSQEAADAALTAVLSLLTRLDRRDVTIHLLCVGKSSILESFEPPATERASFTRAHRSPPLQAAVNAYAAEHDIDLIAMATRQQDSMLDFFRGTNTEQVVAHADRPILSVPIP